MRRSQSDISALIEEEKNNPHAHIHSVQRPLYLPEVIEDKQFLHYDDMAEFKGGITATYEEFIKSPMRKQNRDRLAKLLINENFKFSCFDSIQSSRFITKKKSESVIKKLKGLASKPQSRQFSGQLYIYDRIKKVWMLRNTRFWLCEKNSVNSSTVIKTLVGSGVKFATPIFYSIQWIL